MNRGFLSSQLKNLVWVLSEKILRLISGLLIGVLIARYLGPEEFGRFSYALSWCGIWASLSWLGVGETVVRDLVQKRWPEEIVLGSAFILRSSGAILTLCLCLLIAYFLIGAIEVPFIVFVILGAALCFAEVTGGIWMWFQARSQLSSVMAARNCSIVTGALFKLLVMVLGGGIFALSWVYLLETVILCGAVLIAYKMAAQTPIRWGFDKTVTFTILKESAPLMINSFVFTLNSRIDQLMLGWMMGIKDVGIYAIAVRLSEIWWMFPPVIITVLSPKLFYAAKNNIELTTRCAVMSRVLTCIALVPCAFVGLFSSSLVLMVMGSQYTASSSVLEVHIWLTVLVYMEAPLIQFLITKDLQWLVAAKSVLSVFLNALLGFMLIPDFGLLGAASASLLAQCLSLIGILCIPKASEFRKQVLYTFFFYRSTSLLTTSGKINGS